MGRPKISVVLATYNRAHLLKRSLMSYAVQTFRDFELIVVDDNSQDNTLALLKDWSSTVSIRILHAPEKPVGKWRDCASVINMGLRAAEGEVVLMTHPEVMVGQRTLKEMYFNHGALSYLNAKVYYLTADNQRHLDDVPWEDNLLRVQDLPDFYKEGADILGPTNDYTHEATDRHTNWESWVFGGFSRDAWQRFGPMTEFETWGSIDMDFLNRRNAVGIRTITLMDPESIVIHQNHDVEQGVFKATPRDMTAALAVLPSYRNASEALKGPLWKD